MKGTQSKITIVIPVRNREGLVGRTLDSIGRQTLRPLDVVLIDNCSTDNTLTVLQEWAQSVEGPDFRVSVVEECRPGAAQARNRGLECVETEWTMFFDSDDQMGASHVERVVREIEKYSEIELLGWDVGYVRLDGTEKVLPFEIGDLRAHNILHGSLSTQRYCARTELFRRAGGWNPEVRIWDDIELGERLLKLVSSSGLRKLREKSAVTVYQQADSISGLGDTERVDRCMHALQVMHAAGAREEILGLKMSVLAGDCRRAGMTEWRGILRDALGRQVCARNRILLRLAYFIKGFGIPGSARIVYPFLRKSSPK